MSGRRWWDGSTSVKPGCLPGNQPESHMGETPQQNNRYANYKKRMNELTFMWIMLTELAWFIYIQPLHISECGDISLH